jgi:hypothetical protein
MQFLDRRAALELAGDGLGGDAADGLTEPHQRVDPDP